MINKRTKFPKNIEKRDDDIVIDVLMAKIEADNPSWRASLSKKVKDALKRREVRRGNQP